MKIFIDQLKTLITKYKLKSITELISTNKADIKEYLNKVCEEYNKELQINPIFEETEAIANKNLKSSIKEIYANSKSGNSKRLQSLQILERVINDILFASHSEVFELFALNELNKTDKNLYININNNVANGEVLVEEVTNIYRNGYETKQETKITTKKVIGIELNSTVATNILKRLNKNSKFLKQYCNDYIKSLNSKEILFDKNGSIRFPSVTFSNKIKYEISQNLKKNNMMLDVETIDSFNKHLDLLKKIDAMPIDILSKISEIGFNQSKELMTAITADNMLLENKQIMLDGNKLAEEENIQLENKKDTLLKSLQNFNLQEKPENTEKK